MVVVTAKKLAGSVVLPDISHHTDLITHTAAAKGLEPIALSSTTSRVFNMLVMNAEGTVKANRGEYLGLDEIERLDGTWCQAIHVYRDGYGPHNSFTFYRDEILDSISENPWFKHQWFRENFLRWAELLPRPSEKEPGRVAYFQNPEKRARNIRTPIKPGRFLQKYFSDILSETEIHQLALEWSNEFDPSAARITQNADDIESIYRHGPGSCMTFTGGGYNGSCHPARVYAGPDLGVAYLGSVDDASARAVVWPSKKLYSRLYGDETRLGHALQALGYRWGDSEDFDGARIRRIRHGYEAFVLPYIDCANGAHDEGDFIILTDGHGGLNTESTNGTSEVGPEYRCDMCGDGIDDDDRIYIEDEEQDICTDCCNRHFTYCDGAQDYVRDNKMVDSDEIYGSTRYSLEYLENSGDWFKCEYSDKWFPCDQFDEVETLDGITVCLTEAKKDGFFCQFSEKWSFQDHYRVELTNGHFVHMDMFDSAEHMQQWLHDNDYVAGPPFVSLPDPNQLVFNLNEAA